MKKICLLLTLLSGFIFSACQGQSSVKSDVALEKLYDGLKNPWGIAFLSDGRMLVTERSGEIFVFKNDKYTGAKLVGLPAIIAKGQGGLMDIKVHPDYKKNGWIYITFSKPVGELSTTAVVRFKLKGNQVVEKQDIFDAKPALKADFHFGSRVVFDKDNYLYVSVGERGTQPKVQLLDNDHGKVHRIFDDGKVPTDNPFSGKEGANASIWTYGHRNPQGMVYDAASGRIWSVEHGPKGGDELNLIEKGKNYGWPKASYGINYNGTILTPDKELPGVENPKHYWVPSIGPCGMTIVTSNKYPGWKGNLLVGALAFTHLNRITLDGTTYKSEDRMYQGKGRFRHVTESPDGYIYAVAEGVGANGVVYKLVPAK
ncbi:MAG: PQQ-dependent sugar dehydrogenase [Chitinophagaceae bacterium]|nr:MAG: PQQ-dependent sugar dehydrogenase [Chitinophagaceae bacterium]